MSRLEKIVQDPGIVWRYIRLKLFASKLPKDWLPDDLYLKWAYRVKTGRKLNLKNPKTFTEKLQWLKIHDRKPEYATMVDKFAAKQFVADKIGEKYVVPLVGGPWKSFSEIDFDKLPEQFVLKTTHDSGGIAICRNKATFDKQKAENCLTEHLQTCHWKRWREWAYKNVEPQIIAEKLLVETSKSETEDGALTDYKFFCFDGEPKVMYISKDKGETPQTDFFDMEYNHLPFRMRDPNANEPPEKPVQFEQMRSLAKKLSHGLKQLRVDFYIIDDQIYIGELTFYHCGGMAPITPIKWDYKMGEYIHIP